MKKAITYIQKIMLITAALMLVVAPILPAHTISLKSEIKVKEGCCGCCQKAGANHDQLKAEMMDECACSMEQTTTPVDIPLDGQLVESNNSIDQSLTDEKPIEHLEIVNNNSNIKSNIDQILDNHSPPLFIINSSFLI